MKQAADSLIRLTVSAVLGYAAAGILVRAQNVVALFDKVLTDAVAPVLLPALSDRLRLGGRIGSMHRRKVAYLAVAAWPFFALLALCAEPLVLVLLGPQWEVTVVPVRILALAGLFVPFSAFLLPFLVALDITGRFLPAQAAIQATRTVLAVAASFVSIELVCAALVVEGAMKSVLAHRLLGPHLGYASADLARPLWASAIATAGALAGASLARAALGPDAAPLLVLACSALAAGPPWLAAVLVLGHPVRDEMRRVLARLVPGARTRSP